MRTNKAVLPLTLYRDQYLRSSTKGVQSVETVRASSVPAKLRVKRKRRHWLKGSKGKKKKKGEGYLEGLTFC